MFRKSLWRCRRINFVQKNQVVEGNIQSPVLLHASVYIKTVLKIHFIILLFVWGNIGFQEVVKAECKLTQNAGIETLLLNGIRGREMAWKCNLCCNRPKSVFPPLCYSMPFEAKPADCQRECPNSLCSAFDPIIFCKKQRGFQEGSLAVVTLFCV